MTYKEFLLSAILKLFYVYIFLVRTLNFYFIFNLLRMLADSNTRTPLEW